jgi:hypothetical protein
MRKCAGIGTFFLMILFTQLLFAQNSKIIKSDSLKVSDSITAKDTVKHSPRKATIMSAILPGLGQVYNRKYWKVPVIYAALGVDAYFFFSNRKSYVTFWNAYKERMDTDPATIDPYINIYDNEQLRQLKNYWRKYTEMTVIVGAAIYLINILDATVDAHLYDFDVSDDLSMRISPAVFYTGLQNQSITPGINLTFHLKK